MNKLVKIEYYYRLFEGLETFVTECDKLTRFINLSSIIYVDDSPIELINSKVGEVYLVRVNLYNSRLSSIYVTKDSLNKILSNFDEIIY